MFIGHFGAGLAAKRIAPRPSLGTLFLASQFIDLIWPILLIVGLERVEIDPGNTAVTPLNFVWYPFTHSFLGVLLWALLMGAVYFALRRNTRSAIVLGALVMSHWVLDLITHRPDLPLLPWIDTKVGMGLWDSVALTVIVEGTIFVVGTFLYLKSTRALNAKGTFTFWLLLVFLVAIYVMNLAGPPPPSVEPIGYIGLAQWLFVAWGYWIDRNRTTILHPQGLAQAGGR